MRSHRSMIGLAIAAALALSMCPIPVCAQQAGDLGAGVFIATHGGGRGTAAYPTFAIWADFKNTGGNWQRIFDFGTGTAVNMFLTPRMGSAGSMRFAITTSGGGGESQATAPSTLATGWHHVAVVFDAGSITLYLDGVSVTVVQSALTPSSLGVTTNNWLGRSQYGNDGYLSAKLDDFRIYNKALSPQELARIMQGDHPNFE